MNTKSISTTNNGANTICIEERYGDHYRYFVDANGLLKGEWGDCIKLSIKGPNNEVQYKLYYFKEYHIDGYSVNFMHSKWIIINEYGFFYNKFSCKRYDVVEDVGAGLYICAKNNRYGIIDCDGNEVLHTCYNEIIMKRAENLVFLVRCETGCFIYNALEQKQSKVYDELDFIDSNYIGFKEGEGYGLLNYSGDVVIQPKFERRNSLHYDGKQLQIDFKGKKFGIEIKDNLFYGYVSPNEYDFCFKVEYYDNLLGTAFYITKSGGKYGILNSKFECVSEPVLDDIILADWFKTNYRRVDIGHIFIIGEQGDKYKLFNTRDKTCIVDNCSYIAYSQEAKPTINSRKFHNDFIVFRKEGRLGYVTYNGIIIGGDEYDTVEPFHGRFLVSKNNKYGLLAESGKILIPCENEEIRYNYGDVITVKDGKETIRISSSGETETHPIHEPQHYSKYAGSYAQEEMGYSDEDIDTIFDGDPSAYWNID